MAALHEISTWEETRVALRDLSTTAHLEWRDANKRLTDLLTSKQLTAVQSVGSSYYDRYSYLMSSRVGDRIKELAAYCDVLLQAKERSASDYHTWCDQDV